MVLETANKKRLVAKASMPARAGSPVNPGPEDHLTNLKTQPDAGLDDLVETMIAWAQQAVGTNEIIVASDQFHATYGKVFHDDSFYDARTSYFFDCFLFERPINTNDGRTPYEMFLAEARSPAAALAGPLTERLTWLGDFRHSLFQIAKLSDSSMVLQDLLTPARISVAAKPRESFRGLEKRNLLQGFLFRVGQQNHLSNGLILHPQKAARLIRRHIKQAQKSENYSRKSLLAKLASLQMRALRHRHVDPKAIYEQELSGRATV